jgi:hypothetical protein
MSGLNSKYIPLNFLQQYFIDKDTGLPLAAGVVKFFKDSARTVAKNVYKLSGTVPNYTYTSLGSELELSSSGTFVDESGNDITVYAYPYDSVGTTVELYFVDVYAASVDGGVTAGVFQFSREAVPNTIGASENSAMDGKNFIINGQFTLYNENIIPDMRYDVSTASGGNIFYLYQKSIPRTGAWLYHYTGSGVSNKDYLTLKLFTTGDNTVEGNPVNFLRFECTDIGSGITEKALFNCLTNIKEFSGKEITFSFWGRSSSNSTIQAYFNQEFQSSSTVETLLVSQELTDTWEKYSVTITIPSIAGKTLGANSRVSLGIHFPPSEVCQIDLVNFQINLGEVAYSYEYKNWEEEATTTKALQLPQLPVFYPMGNGADVGGLIPYMSSDQLYYSDDCLTPGSTGTYQYFPRAPIGSCLPSWVESDRQVGYLDCTEVTAVFTYHYKRLYNVIGLKYGTASTSNLHVTNLVGSVITVTNYANGAVTAPSAGTSGFTINVTQAGTAGHPQIFTITCIAATNLLGKYFTFQMPDGVNMYVWFRVDGQGVDPALGGGYYAIGGIFLLSTDTAAQVATKLSTALNPLMFSTPDPDGAFLRMRAAGNARDPDRASRTDRGDGVTGDRVGTKQGDEFKSHGHNYNHSGKNDAGFSGWEASDAGNNVDSVFSTASTGGNETRPVNIYVESLIKY